MAAPTRAARSRPGPTSCGSRPRARTGARGSSACGEPGRRRVPTADPSRAGRAAADDARLARVVDAVLPAGPQEATWDLREQPQAVKAGAVLFARLATPGLVQTRTVIRRAI